MSAIRGDYSNGEASSTCKEFLSPWGQASNGCLCSSNDWVCNDPGLCEVIEHRTSFGTRQFGVCRLNDGESSFVCWVSVKLVHNGALLRKNRFGKLYCCTFDHSSPCPLFAYFDVPPPLSPDFLAKR